MEYVTNDEDDSGYCFRCCTYTARQCGGCSGAPAFDRDLPGARIFYCSSDCQRADWARHKRECQIMQARKSILRAATLLKAILVRIRKNAYPIQVASVERESDTTVTIVGSLAPTGNEAGRSPHPQPLATSFDVFRKHPELFKAVCLSEGGVEAFLYLYSVIRDMFLGMGAQNHNFSVLLSDDRLLDTRPFIKVTEVEVLPANQKLRISGDGLDAACGTGGSHWVYKVEIEYGGHWAMDVTSEQHGHSDASLLILPWSVYVKERCEAVKGEWALGTHRSQPERIWEALQRQPPSGLAHFQALASELDRKIPSLTPGKGGLAALLKAPGPAFQSATKRLLDELEVCVRDALARPAIAGEMTSVVPGLTTTERPFCIRNAPGKGLGWFAATEISKGTRLLSETPLFTFPKHGGMGSELMIGRQVQRLNESQRTAFYALHNIHGGRHTRELGIARTNALPLGVDASEGGIFLEASRINHSCRHNAQNTWNSETGQITIHVMRDVEAGEEITISYLAESATYAAAQAHLRSVFGFACACERCSLPEPERARSDARLNKIAQLDEQIGVGVGIVATPLAYLRHAHEMKRLMDEEGIQDARVARLYYDAFQIAIANGDEARAKVFAERAHAMRVITEGHDSPDTARMKAYAERPAGYRLFGTTMKWRQASKKIPRGLEGEAFEKWLWRL